MDEQTMVEEMTKLVGRLTYPNVPTPAEVDPFVSVALRYAGQRSGRHCMVCAKDLTEEIPVTVFVRRPPSATEFEIAEGVVMCINCGGNGNNAIDWHTYEAIRAVYAAQTGA